MYTKNQIGRDKLAEEIGLTVKWDIERIQTLKEKFSYFHWFHISSSDQVEWSVELIVRFHDSLIWSRLAQNKSLPWSLDFCKDIRNYISWKDFSENFVFYNEFSSDYLTSFLTEFRDEIDWPGLSANQNFKWLLVCGGGSYTRLPLVHFKNFWSYEDLYKNTSFWKYQDRILKEIPEKIDWNKLSKTPNIKWSPKMIREHQREIDWKSLCYRGKIDWTKDLLDEFKNEVDWFILVAHGRVNFTLDIVTYFEDKWNEKHNGDTLWPLLSSVISNDFKLINKYRDKWCWHKLLTRPGINWTEKLTSFFSDEISQIWKEGHWGFNSFNKVLDENRDIEFSITTLEKCAEHWERTSFRGSTRRNGFYTMGSWFYYSSNNRINFEIVKRFGKFLNVSEIINNPNLDWDIPLIQEVINIEIPERSECRTKNYDEDGYIYEQDYIDEEIGFIVTQENIIKEMMKQPHIKNALFMDKLISLKS